MAGIARKRRNIANILSEGRASGKGANAGGWG
jgi:hypothetical protein